MNCCTRIVLVMAMAGFMARSLAADVNGLIGWLLEEEHELKGIPFPEIVRAASGKTVIPINRTNDVDRVLLAKIGGALDRALEALNARDSQAQKQRRINEVSSHFETAIRNELNRVPGFSCDFPKTKAGHRQRSGYPDLRLMDKTSGRVVYLDPKLYERGSRESSFRTFYFEPKRETNKILEDAHHLLAGIEHDGREGGPWRFLRWDLVDLAAFKVRLKAEFQGSNRDLYQRDSIVGQSPPGKTMGP